MRAWAIMLGGLLVWAAHFLLLYGIASALPGWQATNWLVLAATVPAVTVDALLLWWAVKSPPPRDQLESWINRLGSLGAAVSLIAVGWQAASAFVV